jgi:hypothetical protein
MFSSRLSRVLPRDLEAGLVASDPEATKQAWLSPPRRPFTRSARAAGVFIAPWQWYGGARIWAAVADVHAPEAGHGVQVLGAVDIDDGRAIVDEDSGAGLGRRHRLSPWWVM